MKICIASTGTAQRRVDARNTTTRHHDDRPVDFVSGMMEISAPFQVVQNDVKENVNPVYLSA